MEGSYLYGGSWFFAETSCAVTNRDSNNLSNRVNFCGFCVCLIM